MLDRARRPLASVCVAGCAAFLVSPPAAFTGVAAASILRSAQGTTTPVATASASPATPAAMPTPATAADLAHLGEQPIRIDFPQGPIARDGRVPIRVTVVNRTDTTWPKPRVVLDVRAGRLATRARVLAWQDGQLAATSTVASRELPQGIPAGGEISLDFEVLSKDLTLRSQSWNVHGLNVIAFDDKRYLSEARAFVMNSRPDTAPAAPQSSAQKPKTPVAVIAPLTTTRPDLRYGMIPSAAMAQDVQGRLKDQFEVARVPGVTWALDPAVFDEPETVPPSAGGPWLNAEQNSSPTTDTARPTSDATDAVRQFQSDVRRAAQGRDIIALPLFDADPHALGAAGHSATFERILDPTIDRLSGIEYRRIPLAIPATGRITTGAISSYQAADRHAFVLTSSERGDQISDNLPTGARAFGPGLRPHTALYTPASIDALLHDLDRTTPRHPDGPVVDQRMSRPGADAVASHILAELAIHHEAGTTPDEPVIINFPRNWNPAQGSGSRIIQAVANAPWLTLSGLRVPPAADSLPRDRVNLPTEADPTVNLPLLEVSETIRAAEELARVSEVVSSAEAAGHTQRSIAAASSLSWVSRRPLWDDQRKQFARYVEDVRQGIRVEGGSVVNVVSSNVELPITVVNNLNQPVKVFVRLVTSNRRMVPSRSVEVALAPQSRRVVTVPTRAVADGSVSVRAEVVTQSGEVVNVGSAMTVRIRRTWEGRALTLGAGCLAAFVTLGLVRGIRRNQRAKRLLGQDVSRKATL